MARKVAPSHYMAAPPSERADRAAIHGYSTDGEESRAPSDRTLSEYMVANERAAVLPRRSRERDWEPVHVPHHAPHRALAPHGQQPQRGGGHQPGQQGGAGPRAPSRTSRASRHNNASHNHGYDDSSDIYVTSAAYRAPSEFSRGSRGPPGPPSHYSYRSRPPSEVSTVRTKTGRKAGVVVETMSAPNPFCPNTKGVCCLLLLLNLGLILVTLGFVIVIQFFEPFFVWILGIVFLVFGFLTLIGSMVYCVHVCRDAKTPQEVAAEPHYWTHHWQKNFSTPEIRYKSEEKYPDDRFSDRYSVSKYSEKYSDRGGHRDRY
ncbi:uncharacterized protein LOC113207818 [Frankliniella occidentalis]|uniref:Uncharacterized protein LOC113207818 n=1 Tax=Frankliniella occidentalis TaxID=133901 RepID=A0A6J1SLY2_FRAOC|nr:uncharacterized protein LOC113207818 [Frankliniella occidentalis]